jgi:hypothetical protein
MKPTRGLVLDSMDFLLDEYVVKKHGRALSMEDVDSSQLILV